MKGLTTLIRLHRLKLTEQQRRLATLQAAANGLRADIETLAQAARSEADAAAADPETGHTLGAFVQAVLARRRALNCSLADVEREIEGIRGHIAAAFRELKRYELVEERRQNQARLARQRRDRHVENEVGMTMHRRGKAAAQG